MMTAMLHALEPSPSDIEDLAAAAAAGDAEALGALYDRYFDFTYRYVYVRVKDRARAEDVTAQAWFKACRNISGYSPRGNGFPAWIITITKNTLTDSHRSAGRSREVPTSDMLAIDTPAPGQSPEAAALASDLSTQIHAALAKLPRTQGQVVTLRFFNGLDMRETASVLGITVANVKTAQHRGLKALAKSLPDLRILNPSTVVTSVVTAAPATKSTTAAVASIRQRKAGVTDVS